MAPTFAAMHGSVPRLPSSRCQVESQLTLPLACGPHAPRRVRRLYLGEQRAPAVGAGELNYDTYQVASRTCMAGTGCMAGNVVSG